MKNKVGGADEISAKMIKSIIHYIKEPLAYIFNLCIEKAIWPNILKTAEVVPIYKAGVKTDVSNYRPISLISNFFEKIIHVRLLSFLMKHNIISKKQFGFIKNRGTTVALNYISDKIYKNLDKSIPTIAAFLDLSKAFDTVDHKILLYKLERHGIRGQALELMKSYLSDRQQIVKINNCKSDSSLITTGVPQGTILGPLLFIIYVNDLLEDLLDIEIASYADDTIIIASSKTWAEAAKAMNKNLQKVANWLALNKLSLNISKTVYMTFGNYCDSVPVAINIRINNQPINRVTEHKYLGIIFDYNMKWNMHIKYVMRRTKYLIFIFAKLKNIMDTKTLMMIYYAFFHSIVKYGIIAWGGLYNNNLNLIQNV